MLQLVRSVMRDSSDSTELALLFANQTEKDILLREELEQAAADSNGRFKLWYTVDSPSEGKLLLLSLPLFTCKYSPCRFTIFKIRFFLQVGSTARALSVPK